MSIKPILMNTEMVRATLDGRKTVTRRVVKLKYSNTHLEMRTDKYGTRLIELQNEEPGVTTIKKTDGTTTHTLLAAREVHAPCRPGDVLYVRETWYKDAGRYMYRADCSDTEKFYQNGQEIHIRWRPSIHMPREAARIWLRVTDVRVERLQEIDGREAEAEGAITIYNPLMRDDKPTFDAYRRKWFAKLWDSTIKPADRERYGWASNPWVWVIEFERCGKPEEG